METVKYIVFALIGALIHIGFKYKNAWQSDKKVNHKVIWFNSAFSFIIACVVIFMRDDLYNIYPVNKLSSLFLGYMADSILLNWINRKKKQIEHNKL